MNKSIVITGSTRGIGYNLAAAFMAKGCAVTLSGRTQEAVDAACSRLLAEYSPELSFGLACDVTDYLQVKNLWESAKNRFGTVDIWINNAGISTYGMKFWEYSPGEYSEVVRTNILGTMHGTKVALSGMIAQGHGALYNVEGFGARGGSRRGLSLYGSTKAATHFLDRSLCKEIAGTSVISGGVFPGMVITDLVTRQFEGREEELEKNKRILNIIAEKPEVVAPVLAEKILNNRKNGATIAYNSSIKMMLKFLTAPFNKRDLFS